MMNAPIAADDFLRVRTLQGLEILDTPEESDYTQIVQLAAAICKTPIALISLLDNRRQWFKAKTGVTVSQTPRDISFCGHAILHSNPFFQVEDTLLDSRFCDNPMVIAPPHIRFYAGIQLIGSKGYKIGMLCVNDTKPNALTTEQISALEVLANAVSKLMELRFIHKQSDERNKKIESLARTEEMLLQIMAHDSALYQRKK